MLTNKLDIDVQNEEEEDHQKSSANPIEIHKENTVAYVIFCEKLYCMYNRYASTSYVYEYFTYRTIEDKENDYHYSFTIHWDKKLINTSYSNEFFNQSLAGQKEMFNKFLKEAQYVNDKSESELCAIHSELLRAKIVRKLLDSPSVHIIKAREDEHRQYIRNELHDFFLKVPNDIYKWAQDGQTTVEFTLYGINERRITSYETKKPFYQYPCIDGILRPTFKEYVYYILSGLYPGYDEKNDHHIWIGLCICDRLRQIYPHFTIEIKECPDLIIPKIIIHTNVNVQGILK